MSKRKTYNEKSTSCERICQQLGAYADGELSLWQALAVAAHVKRCARCAEELTFIRSVGEQLRLDVPDIPEDIHTGVMQQIRAEGRVRVDQPDRKPIWQSRTAVALATGAVAMLLLVVLPLMPKLQGYKSDMAPESAVDADMSLSGDAFEPNAPLEDSKTESSDSDGLENELSTLIGPYTLYCDTGTAVVDAPMEAWLCDAVWYGDGLTLLLNSATGNVTLTLDDATITAPYELGYYGIAVLNEQGEIVLCLDVTAGEDGSIRISRTHVPKD